MKPVTRPTEKDQRSAEKMIAANEDIIGPRQVRCAALQPWPGAHLIPSKSRDLDDLATVGRNAENANAKETSLVNSAHGPSFLLNLAFDWSVQTYKSERTTCILDHLRICVFCT